MSSSVETAPTNEEREAQVRQYEVLCPHLNVEVHPDDEMYTYPIRQLGWSRAGALADYLRIGRVAFSMLEQILAWLGRSWDDLAAVLDFASGYGRTTRFMATALPAHRIWISDILVPAVAFQKRTFGVHGFISAAQPRDLVIPREYDFISVVSLFSHLPHSTFGPWLVKLMKALGSGSVMVFTTHGPDQYKEQFGEAMNQDFVFNPVNEIPSLDVESYGRSFCSRTYVERLIGQIPGSTLLTYVPNGLNKQQDVYVVGSRCRTPEEPCLLRNLPLVAVDIARCNGSGSVEIAGWALDGEDFGPVPKVDLFLDGIYVGSPRLGLDRPDLTKAFGRQESAKGGWRFSGKAPHEQRKAKWATALVEDAHGLQASAVQAAQ